MFFPRHQWSFFIVSSQEIKQADTMLAQPHRARRWGAGTGSVLMTQQHHGAAGRKYILRGTGKYRAFKS